MQVSGGRSSERDGMDGFATDTVGRSSENDGMDGFATDTVGRSNEGGGILGSKLSSRRNGGAVAESGESMAARAESVGEGVGWGEAAERRGSSKALRSGSENLIVNVYVWCVGGELMWDVFFLHEEEGSCCSYKR